jgi:alkanesulfonate monooxygenase SsuD/methylene tetrahydromethanopterin reductase-like flavin-dependent oxidoreductase (luciferase family)
VRGTTSDQLTEWAKAADEAGFASLGTIDRIVYPNYEPLVALSAAAVLTERIRLTTAVMLGPLRMNAALLAKQLLTLDALAGGGRTVLGIGIGGREDDYEISGADMSTRGKWMDDALAKILNIWRGDGDLESQVGPRPTGDGPSLIVGGYVQASFERAARFADGWIQGGSGPAQFGDDATAVDDAWKQAGRDGKARKLALAYFSLGPDAEKNAQETLAHYYTWLGAEGAAGVAAGAAKDAAAVQAMMAAFEEKGCDELILFPANGDPAQVGLLAEAAGL